MSEIHLAFVPEDRRAEVQALHKIYKRNVALERVAYTSLGIGLLGGLASSYAGPEFRLLRVIFMGMIHLPFFALMSRQENPQKGEIVAELLRQEGLPQSVKKKALSDLASSLEAEGSTTPMNELDWLLFANILRDKHPLNLRIKIIQLATQFGRIEFLPLIDDLYAGVDLSAKKLMHSEAAAVSQARLILRTLAAQSNGGSLRKGEK